MLKAIKSVLKKLGDYDAPFDEGKYVAIDADRIQASGRQGLRALRFEVAAPGVQLSCRTDTGNVRISTQGGALEGDPEGDPPRVVRGDDYMELDGELESYAQSAPWLTRELAERLCSFGLSCYVDDPKESEARAWLDDFAVRAGLLDPASISNTYQTP